MNPSSSAITLKFQVGIPQQLALAYAEGKPSQSRFSGDQLMWTTTSGDRFYTEPYFGERIRAARVAIGEPIEVEKVETWTGNRRTVEFQVRRLGASAVSATPAPRMETTVHPNPTPAPPPLPQLPQAPVNGQGETAAAIMARCYRDAINIAAGAVLYAQEQNLRITPDFADVRALAATLCINETGGRR